MKGQKTGGRSKGTPNKATAEIKAAAQLYGEEALSVLAKIMRNTKAAPQARVAAVKEILDRGYGKPTQTIAGDPDQPQRVLVGLSNLTNEELDVLERLAGKAAGPH